MMKLKDLITLSEDILQIWEVIMEDDPLMTVDASVIVDAGQFEDVLTKEFLNRDVLSIKGGKNCIKVLIKG